MSDQDHSPEQADEQRMQDEVLLERKFSLEEAIGRMAGGNLMKGASPVTLRRQAELLLEEYLQQHLTDSEGALRRVLLRGVSDSEELLEAGYEQPLVSLRNYLAKLIASPALLEQFVTAVDREWGRMYRERPHFERPGQVADADDPYTGAGVQAKLERLATTLEF